MPIVTEYHRGNAVIYMCDDSIRSVTPEGMRRRDAKAREAVGRIAATPGAAERLKIIEAWHKEHPDAREGMKEVIDYDPVAGPPIPL